MGLVKELPKLERPREKAARYGIETLSDSELLSILLNNGYQGYNAIQISTDILNKYNGLNNLSKIPVSEFKKNKGIKTAKAMILAAIFEIHNRLMIKSLENEETIVDEDYLAEKYYHALSGANQECFVVVIVNSKKQILFERILYRGTENMLTISFDDIYRILIEQQAKYYYLIHNHVQGDCSPSEYDLISTNSIVLQSKKHGKVMLDHLIISQNCYYSFSKKKKTTISC